jgi:pyruvate,orthophosphate dikinase
MFFEGNRIDAMRQMILADNEVDRRKALKKLLPYQRKDFQGIFKALEGTSSYNPFIGSTPP